MIDLDNAATSFPKPEGVYAALEHFARHAPANPVTTRVPAPAGPWYAKTGGDSCPRSC